jgi:hypothetical protein
MDFLSSLENSGFATWLRESPSVFAYPTLLAFHTFGMAFLVGMTVAIALRSLGVARSLALAPLESFFPFVWIGFWVSAVSGVLLLAIDARTFLTMPAFYIKILAIAGAVVSARLLRAEVFGASAHSSGRSVSSRGKVLASAVLVLWTIAITAGRVTAYDAWIGWETAAAVLTVAVLVIGARWAVHRLVGPGSVERVSESSRSARRPA